MRYSKIHKLDVSNGEGVGVALFVQGCHFHCKNCFNSETWDFDKGKEWTLSIKQKFLELIDKPHITRVSILGGEPLADENIQEVFFLLQEIKERFPDKKIWLYTGYTIEQTGLINPMNDFFKGDCDFKTATDNANKNLIREYIICQCDVLVDGQYIDELKDISLKFRGSSNQRIINVKKSLEENQVVLYIK